MTNQYGLKGECAIKYAIQKPIKKFLFREKLLGEGGLSDDVQC